MTYCNTLAAEGERLRMGGHLSVSGGGKTLVAVDMRRFASPVATPVEGRGAREVTAPLGWRRVGRVAEVGPRGGGSLRAAVFYEEDRVWHPARLEAQRGAWWVVMDGGVGAERREAVTASFLTGEEGVALAVQRLDGRAEDGDGGAMRSVYAGAPATVLRGEREPEWAREVGASCASWTVERTEEGEWGLRWRGQRELEPGTAVVVAGGEWVDVAAQQSMARVSMGEFVLREAEAVEGTRVDGAGAVPWGRDARAEEADSTLPRTHWGALAGGRG